MTDPEVVLIRDPDCPNVSEARANLVRALDATGKQQRWREFDRNAADTPAEWRIFGSPTILVNGWDVGAAEPNAGGNSCRIYRSPDGRLIGVPSVEQISAALRTKKSPEWTASLTVLPAFAVALLPSVTCPACWPGYAALLSSFGLGVLPTTRHLLPLTLAALLIPLGLLGVRARRRQGFLPLALGLLGASSLVMGRFVLGSNPLLYSGVGLLMGASIWSSRTNRRRIANSISATSCQACDMPVAQAKAESPF